MMARCEKYTSDLQIIKVIYNPAVFTCGQDSLNSEEEPVILWESIVRSVVDLTTSSVETVEIDCSEGTFNSTNRVTSRYSNVLSTDPGKVENVAAKSFVH